MIGALQIDGAEPQWCDLVLVRTDRGDFHEHPRNLRVMPKPRMMS